MYCVKILKLCSLLCLVGLRIFILFGYHSIPGVTEIELLYAITHSPRDMVTSPHILSQAPKQPLSQFYIFC